MDHIENRPADIIKRMHDSNKALLELFRMHFPKDDEINLEDNFNHSTISKLNVVVQEKMDKIRERKTESLVNKFNKNNSAQLTVQTNTHISEINCE